MTGILFTGHSLHADRKVAHDGLPTTFTHDGKKIFLSRDETFAYGITDLLPKTEDERDRIEMFLHDCVVFNISTRKKQNRSTEYHAIADVSDVDTTPFHGDVLLMTKTSGFFVCHDATTSRVCINAIDDKIMAIGSSGNYLFGAYHQTRDIARTFQVANQLDSFTGTEYLSIYQDDLKSFILNPISKTE